MKGRVLILVAILNCVVLTSLAQNRVSGFVFEDSNRNGLFDAKETGLSGVAVSNGTDVVQTNNTGKYELPATNDMIIFVVKPSGFQVPMSQNNLPLFYYNHKPGGSPEFKFKGVDPSGDLPESVDFPLYKVNENNQFKILLFGDPQPYTKKELDFFDKRIVSELEQTEGVAFGISMGDEVGNDPNLFVPYSNVTAKIGIPWYNVMGNHDMNHDAKSDSLSDESFERAFGPATYSFNYGKTHFIIIDDILSPDPRDNAGYWGGFTPAQITFLENDLKLVPKDHLIVIALHIPIWEGYHQNDIFRDSDRDALFTLLQDFPNTLSISAHTHIQFNKFMTKEDGWLMDKPHHHLNLGTTCGAWYRGALDENGVPLSVMADGTPQGYAFLEINENQYKVQYKAATYPDDYQMSIYCPKIIGKAKKSLASFYVNFFMGSKNDKVSFRIDGGPWKKMNYSVEYDPSYLNLLHQWDFSETVIPGRRPIEPRDCLHLWKATLPSDLEVGKHDIEIKVEDIYDQEHFGTVSYRIGL